MQKNMKKKYLEENMKKFIKILKRDHYLIGEIFINEAINFSNKTLL